jgi:hypothetical protein
LGKSLSLFKLKYDVEAAQKSVCGVRTEFPGAWSSGDREFLSAASFFILIETEAVRHVSSDPPKTEWGMAGGQ